MDTLTTPPVVTGTSLAVLQAYPLGTLEVQIRNYQGMTLTGKVIGLLPDYFKVRTNELRRPAAFSYTDKDVLPILRPFSALCDELPDGRVPAVEVAKLIMQANRPEGRTPIANYGDPILKQGGEIVSVDCHRTTSYTLEVLIDATWAVCTVYDFGICYAHNMAAIVDYLRSQHFALPVNGRPLVEGVDYIAK